MRSTGGRLRFSSVKKLNMPPPSRAPGKAARAAAKKSRGGGAGGQGLPGRVHLRSGAGDTSTTGKGDPSVATARPSAAISSLKPSTETITASSHGVGAEHGGGLDEAAQGRLVMALARIVVADHMGDADGAQHVRMRPDRPRVGGIEPEAELRHVAQQLADGERDVRRSRPPCAGQDPSK